MFDTINRVINYIIVILCTILYYLYNLKNVKNTHGGVLLSVNLQAASLK